ncbi:porin [Caballeronia novacaledonica]|uniref:Porin n=1 Tax=Caballeronia novacaledonica TaxID=1544861 RepID=A0AA37MS48_9BURK|nr:porin [Caballeronia novacaledonica]GJH25587.1 porin [Caballeronia novacaledonica]
MKKTGFIAASLFTVAPCVHAQNSVVMFGLVDAGISYISNRGGASSWKMDDGIGVPNLFGLQGSEDIDASTKAVFRLVAQYMLGTGSIVGFKSNADQSSGLLFSREAFVGLADDHLGTLTFGRQQDFMVDTLLGDVDADAAAYVGGFYNFRDGPFAKLALPDSPPGEAYDFDHMSGSQPLSNSIKYKSPTFAGMSVGYLFAFGNTAGNFRQNSASSAGGSFAAGPFAIGAAYTSVRYAELGGGAIQNIGAGLRYKIGTSQISALFTNTRNTANGATVNMVQAGGLYRFTSSIAFGADYMYMWGNEVVDRNHAHQVTAVAQYILSKRTTTYVDVVYQIANSGATASINGTFGPSSSRSQCIGRVGIQTRF